MRVATWRGCCCDALAWTSPIGMQWLEAIILANDDDDDNNNEYMIVIRRPPYHTISSGDQAAYG